MDNSLFEKLVLQNEDTLYRISMSLLKNEADAQDAVGDAILKAYEKQSTLKNQDAFAPWLIKILIRCCYKQLKYQKRFENSEQVLLALENRDNPYQNLEAGAAINSLSPKIRTVFVLYYVEGYSVKEIKNILSLPEGTVKSRLSAGRKQLKEQL